MAQITITYALSKTGQRASLLAGGDGKATQTLVVTPEHPRWPDAVAVAEIDNDGNGKIKADYCRTQVNGRHEQRAYAAPQDVATIIADEVARMAYLVAEEKKEAERKEAEAAKKLAKLTAAGAEGLIHYTGIRWTTTRDADDLRDRLGSLYAEAEAIAAARSEEERAKQDAAATARQAAKDAAVAEMAEWIKAHGSPRLKRCLAEGLNCESVYRDERLAIDRPGWAWERATDGSYIDPRNPPMEAFALLDEARKTDPAARLVYWQIEKDEDDYDPEDDSKYAWQGYAAVADFLDREIVYGVNA